MIRSVCRVALAHVLLRLVDLTEVLFNIQLVFKLKLTIVMVRNVSASSFVDQSRLTMVIAETGVVKHLIIVLEYLLLASARLSCYHHDLVALIARVVSICNSCFWTL